MRTFFCFSILCFLVSSTGCGESKRPRVGDRVLPQIFVTEPVHAGSKMPVGCKIFVSAKGSNTSTYLTFEEIPDDVSPKMEITFFSGDEVVEESGEIALKRDC